MKLASELTKNFLRGYNMQTRKLIEDLKQAAQAYYQDGTVIMTDEEYDAKLEALELLDPEAARELLMSPSAGTAPTKNLIKHDNPMLSLAKAKTEEELEKYYNKLTQAGSTGFTLQAKLDGVAMSIIYKDGKVERLVTRGDGTQGEDTSYLLADPDLTVKGLPLTLNDESFKSKRIELRGEVFATHSQFEDFRKARLEATGEDFSNSRNAVSGIIKKAESGLGYKAEITFATYSVFVNEEPTAIEVLSNENLVDIKELSRTEVKAAGKDPKKVCEANSYEDFLVAVKEFGEIRSALNIPTDGIVIKPKNEIEMLNKMGYTSHHPIAYMAYKYPGAKALTTVKNITVTVGKTGKLTPQAEVEPVEVDGVVITNITCHNFNWLYEMGISVGSQVQVMRANDVIPAIASVVTAGDEMMSIPTHCPECESILTGDGLSIPKTLVCTNESCPSRLYFYIKSIVSRQYLHIDGLGDVALEPLIENKTITGIVSLFSLNEATLAETVTGVTSTGNVRKFGAGNAKNVIASIEASKVNTESHRLLASLNIPGMGPNTAKKLILHFNGLESLLNVSPSELYEINGIGETLVTAFAHNQDRVRAELTDLLKLGVKIHDPIQKVATSGSFSVSGSVDGFANRADFVAYMESLGWEYHKSPKADTDVLFADPEGTSSKIKKARANGTKITLDLKEIGIK